MKLAELIRGASPAQVATLTLATPATHGPTVATVATVTVANAQGDETRAPAVRALTGAERRAVADAYRALARTLDEQPDTPRAIRTVEAGDDAAYVLLAVAVRGAGYATLRVPRERYNGFKVLELLERRSAP